MNNNNDAPTAEEVVKSRERVGDIFNQAGNAGTFDPRDLHDLMSEIHLLNRYFNHVRVHNYGGNRMDQTVNMIIRSLKFRRQTGIRDLTVDHLHGTLKTNGQFYLLPANVRDRDNCRILGITVHLHSTSLREECKKVFLYLLEKVDTECNGREKITVVLDCTRMNPFSQGDVKFMMFFLSTLKDNMPDIVNNIIILNMNPFVGFIWTLIRGMLNQETQQKVKFVDTNSIDEFVTAENRLEAWGGTGTWPVVLVN